jgi:hypothetical protein
MGGISGVLFCSVSCKARAVLLYKTPSEGKDSTKCTQVYYNDVKLGEFEWDMTGATSKAPRFIPWQQLSSD